MKTFTAFCVMSKFMSIATFKLEFPHRPKCKIPAIKLYMHVHQGNWCPAFFRYVLFNFVNSDCDAMKKRNQLNCCKCNIRVNVGLRRVRIIAKIRDKKSTCYRPGENVRNAYRRPKWRKNFATLIFIFIMFPLHFAWCISIVSVCVWFS